MEGIKCSLTIPVPLKSAKKWPSYKQIKRKKEKKYCELLVVFEMVLLKFCDCKILRDHQLVTDDLWVEDGKILNPEKVFFDEQRTPDIQYNCNKAIIAPGFIDVQINGALGCDFSLPSENFKSDIQKVAKFLLSHGVTSFCPTIVTSPENLYKEIICNISKTEGSSEGAGILGLHLEGPFISKEKRGAHPSQYIIETLSGGFQQLIDMYGSLDSTLIVTIAPELQNSSPVIEELVKRDIKVSVGHSVANLSQGEEAVRRGATFITHLFNAMLPFHHRDPHLVGLLSSDNIPAGTTVYYGMITDGIHTDPAAIRIAHRTHPEGLVIVTDAICAMGLLSGTHHIGQQKVEIKDNRAFVAGTNTLSGSISTMNHCVKYLLNNTECTKVEALEAASLHPAKLLNITHRKGTLDYYTDADFLILDEKLNVHATYIAGEQVWASNDAEKYVHVRVDPFT